MRRRDRDRRKRLWSFLIIPLVVAAAILTVYFIWMQRDHEEERGTAKKKVPNEMEPVPHVRLKTPPIDEWDLPKDITEKMPPEEEDHCIQIENDVQDFFAYLNNKDYIQSLEPGIDTYERFKGLIKKLSSLPPIPAGEGIDSMIMTKNIFHLFRILDRKDLRLIKEIMRKEADTLDMNLDMFYKWVMSEDRCPDPEGMRPSLDLLYQYAGFFLNTIGGRAYLFRRPVEIRLLISYYCLLIVHEADKRGKNVYGIDIFPEIASITKEISFYPDFHFQNEYILRLTSLQDFYLEKR